MVRAWCILLCLYKMIGDTVTDDKDYVDVLFLSNPKVCVVIDEVLSYPIIGY
jgi:hypothetical protein